MTSSEQLDKLAAALSAAQAELVNPSRDRGVTVATKSGGSYKFEYTTLDTILDMARPILAKHGLSIVQSTSFNNGAVITTTRLMHSSGQWIEDSLGITPDSISPQAIGSAATYGRRYSIAGFLNIASEYDDDGNHASGNTVEHATDRPKLPPCPECGSTRAVIVGKEEYGGGLVCFKKKGGCGYTWKDGEDSASAKPAKRQPKEKPADKAEAKSDKPPYETARDMLKAAATIADLTPLVARVIGSKNLSQEEKHTLLRLAENHVVGLPNETEADRVAIIKIIGDELPNW